MAQTDNAKKAEREQNLLISKPAFKPDSKFICVLQGIDYKMLASIEFDVAVVDSDDSKLSKDNIINQHSQNKVLIAYLSIGEAENYRNYWQKDWKPGNPVFLDKENPSWKGNFKVKYWYSDWQKIVFDSLSKIIDKGYDGLNAIDGVGRESLWFLCDSLQDKDELAISLGYLNQIIEASKFVFAINYCQKEENIEIFITLAQKYGFIPYTASGN